MKNIGIKLLFVILVVCGSLYLILFKPTKLGLDLKGGIYVVLEAVDDGKTVIDNDAMERLVSVIDRRINGIGVAESNTQIAANNRVIIEMPGLTNPEEAVALVGKTALLEFKLVQDDGTLGETLLTGRELDSAKVGYDELGRPQIEFKMKADGAEQFAKITRENIGKQLAITLDGQIQTAPRIQSEIPGGSGVITGDYTIDQAKSTAMLLNAGALPITAKIVETRTVGATLGDESIAQSKNAAIVAMCLIWLFMVIFYKLPGLMADLALAIFGLITMGVLNFIDATLTLPGIAGLILSAGMAVDANVIIFERIKEELRVGNSVLNSIDTGFNKGFLSILDSNVTTLIITVVLFVFGTGTVKGFAVTLSIGTIASMFTAIAITKVLLVAFVRTFHLKKPSYFGVKEVRA